MNILFLKSKHRLMPQISGRVRISVDSARPQLLLPPPPPPRRSLLLLLILILFLLLLRLLRKFEPRCPNMR